MGHTDCTGWHTQTAQGMGHKSYTGMGHTSYTGIGHTSYIGCRTLFIASYINFRNFVDTPISQPLELDIEISPSIADSLRC